MLNRAFAGNGKFLAPVAPAVGKHAAAIRSSHSLPESMCPLSFNTGGLIRTFHALFVSDS
jgi:hypothetical protein